ncbi:MAG: putative bifunctional diguanylate cyclase/phosphodiesterase, partial [Burkholderiaceae bacterium]
IVVDAMYRQRGKYVSTAQLLEQIKIEQQEKRISATAFESKEAMMITDAESAILRVNQAFTEITGYTPEESVGNTPRMLKSGRHNAAFYEAMWGSIHRTGSWQGEIWDRRKNGEIFPCWSTITAVKNDAGTVSHYVCAQTDITSRKAAEEAINQLVFFDVLTGLPNRRLLMDRLQQVLAASTRTGREGALMFIDLDNFKILNDTLGHDMGDLLLQQVAKRLSICIREGDTVGRLGGDEFVIILEDLNVNTEKAAQQVESICASILAALNVPYDLAGHKHRSTPSIGVTLFSDHKISIADLYKRADLAMYQAKASGRNSIRFYDSKLQDAVNTHVALEEAFRHGLQQNEFILHFQVQVDGESQVSGVEALIRWRHPQRGLLAPDEFIPLAEETGLIIPMGQWVLEAACTQQAKWAAQPGMSHLTIAVNVSAVQFRRPDYVEQVLAVLDRTGADPHKLKFEITESVLVADVEDIILKMEALQSHGISFSLDDFGTGYSSLAYIKRLPLDQLKIDRSFMSDVLNDQNNAAIVRTIVSLGQSFGLTVIAEGVENEAQRLFLTDHDCHAFQGFLFGRPLPLTELEHLMTRIKA